jgi:hypothetical protein
VSFAGWIREAVTTRQDGKDVKRNSNSLKSLAVVLEKAE